MVAKAERLDQSQEMLAAKERYKSTFLDIVDSRLPSGVDYSTLMNRDGFQLSLNTSFSENKIPIELPKGIQFLVAQAFRGFPVDDKTFEPKLRVGRVSFLENLVAIDIEPTIETPKRAEGREELFITFPDYSNAVSSRIIFNMNRGDYIINFGNPNGRSEWIFGDTHHPIPYKSTRHQLAPDNINELTDLAREISARPHSNLTSHKVR